MNVLVLFTSRHGQTRRVAEAIGATLSKRGWTPDLRDVAVDPPGRLEGYAGAILASPIHTGHHAKKIVSFARRHRRALDVLPSAFVSVSLTQSTVESATATAEQRKQAHEDLSVALGDFVESSGWHPRSTLRVAGALPYTRYNWLVRWVMKRIVKAQGGSTDTSRDHEYTNWDALERFASDFADALHRTRAGEVDDTATAGPQELRAEGCVEPAAHARIPP